MKALMKKVEEVYTYLTALEDIKQQIVENDRRRSILQGLVRETVQCAYFFRDYYRSDTHFGEVIHLTSTSKY